MPSHSHRGSLWHNTSVQSVLQPDETPRRESAEDTLSLLRDHLPPHSTKIGRGHGRAVREAGRAVMIWSPVRSRAKPISVRREWKRRRVRARRLFNKGFKRLSDLKYASPEDLASISQIGKVLARDILAQIQSPSRKSKRSVFAP